MELLFVKSGQGDLFLDLWAPNLSRSRDIEHPRSSRREAGLLDLTIFFFFFFLGAEFRKHATKFFFLQRLPVPGSTRGASVASRRIHPASRHHGPLHWAGHRPQRHSDHCVPDAQEAEAATQLRSGEHGCGRPGHSSDRRRALCRQQRPGLLLPGTDGLRDGGLRRVPVW